MNEILQIESLSFSYERQKAFFSDFNLSICKSEIVGILGANGAGKTTLFEIVNGYKKGYFGKILIDGKNLKSYSLMEKARHIAYIQQMTNSQDLYQDAFHFVLDGRRPYSRLGNYSKADFAVVESLLSDYDLAEFRNTLVSSLSGGEYQRCVLARALAQQTNLVVCDEPFSAMDIRYQKEFRNKIIEASRERETAFLISLHDVNLALQFCTKVVFLKHGTLCFYGNPTAIDTKILENVYDTSFELIEKENRKLFVAL